MKRKNPFLTPLGFGLTLVLFLSLGGIFRVQGGMLFSPGKVSAKTRPGVVLDGFNSHADFEQQCQRCHRPLETTQDVLCLDCHLNIEQQLLSQSGTHARLDNARRCAECHSDHQGREFDPTQAALSHFDHSGTRFSLIRHPFDYAAVPMTCDACHTFGVDFAFVQDSCASCHAKNSAEFINGHKLEFGDSCLDCHDGLDTMVRFNHRETDFPLDGQHSGIPCAGCHTGGQFEGLPGDCISCHEEPDQHRGLFAPQCSTCHTTLAWSPAIIEGAAFDHVQDTRFSLVLHGVDYQNAPITCLACHPDGVQQFAPETCRACHWAEDGAFMDEHDALFGGACMDCHDGVDRLSDFDHANFFPLEDRHAETACEACHASQVFRGTPTACAQCHEEPQIHAGAFGLKCGSCHTAQAWTPARLTEHAFPLDHGESGLLDCETCHLGSYTEYTCYECHDHQPAEMERKHLEEGISPGELADCARCHPTGKEGEGREIEREDD